MTFKAPKRYFSLIEAARGLVPDLCAFLGLPLRNLESTRSTEDSIFRNTDLRAVSIIFF